MQADNDTLALQLLLCSSDITFALQTLLERDAAWFPFDPSVSATDDVDGDEEGRSKRTRIAHLEMPVPADFDQVLSLCTTIALDWSMRTNHGEDNTSWADRICAVIERWPAGTALPFLTQMAMRIKQVC